MFYEVDSPAIWLGSKLGRPGSIPNIAGRDIINIYFANALVPIAAIEIISQVHEVGSGITVTAKVSVILFPDVEAFAWPFER